MLHRFPDRTAFDQRAVDQEFAHHASSTKAQAALAEQYVGMPFE
jgi:p-hydroxybenzoate 3-monooxygenase